MSNLIFLGAGASKAFGIPTMQEMVTEFEKTIKKDNKECFEFYFEIKNTLIEKYGSQHVDIESILSVLNGIVSQITIKELGHYAYYHIQKFCKSKNITYPEDHPVDEYIDKAKKIEDSLKKYIRKKCDIELSNESHDKVYQKSYLPFFNTIDGNKKNYPNHNLTINWKAYTTNYDNIFEGFWDAFESPKDHFVKESSANNYFLLSDELHGDQTFCKLHGSLNWTKEKETGRIIKKQISGYNIYDTEGDVMLFPTQQKDLYLHPWFTLFSDLRKGLQNQSNWYVVGYSFNDEFIRNVFQEILSYNSDKRLIIINPIAEKVRNKFPKSVKNQIDTVPIKFGSDFFALQFDDYHNKIKTLVIKFDSTSDKITIFCNNEIISAQIKKDCKVQIRNADGFEGNDSKSGEIYENNLSVYFPIHNPNKLKVKIEIKIKYNYNDEIELRFSDGTKKINYEINYGTKVIASSHNIQHKYEDVNNISCTTDPIKLGKIIISD